MGHDGPVTVATTAREVAAAAARLANAPRVAFDLESNGLFVYKARICAVQLAAAGEVVVVDALTAPLEPLSALLGEGGPVKVVHDVAFDARMLAEQGIPLGNCHDTSIAARMLGRTSTGLQTLLLGELGVAVDKSLQSHDWGKRPFDAATLAYLASDVLHLDALDDALWAAVEGAGIASEVDEETRYRLQTAIAAASEVDPRPPYARVKGVERVPAPDLPLLRRLAELREREAARLDVPPYKVLANEVLVAIAAARPKTLDDLRRVRGAAAGPRAGALANDVLRAVAQGIADGRIPDDERALFERPRVPASVGKLRRARESRLLAWRRGTAKARSVDEQVVLPGHCVKELADRGAKSTEELASVPGLGAFRVARDGEAIVRALNHGADEP
jgi:ribonuclease D